MCIFPFCEPFLGLGPQLSFPLPYAHYKFDIREGGPPRHLSAKKLRWNRGFFPLVVSEEERKNKEKEKDDRFLPLPSSGLPMKVLWSPFCLQRTTPTKQKILGLLTAFPRGCTPPSPVTANSPPRTQVCYRTQVLFFRPSPCSSLAGLPDNTVAAITRLWTSIYCQNC